MAHTCFFLSKTAWKITSQKTLGNTINQMTVSRISKWHFKFVPDMTARSGLFFLVKILLKFKPVGKQSAYLFKTVVFLYGQHEDYSLLQACVVRLHVSVYKPTLNSLGLEIKVWQEEDLCGWSLLEKCALGKIWEVIHPQCQSYIFSFPHKGTQQGKIQQLQQYLPIFWQPPVYVFPVLYYNILILDICI